MILNQKDLDQFQAMHTAIALCAATVIRPTQIILKILIDQIRMCLRVEETFRRVMRRQRSGNFPQKCC